MKKPGIDADEVERDMKAGKFGEKKQKEERGQVRGGSFSRAENGYTVNYDHEPKKGKDGDPGMYQPSKQHVFGGKEEMLKHMGECLD